MALHIISKENLQGVQTPDGMAIDIMAKGNNEDYNTVKETIEIEGCYEGRHLLCVDDSHPHGKSLLEKARKGKEL